MSSGSHKYHRSRNLRSSQTQFLALKAHCCIQRMSHRLCPNCCRFLSCPPCLLMYLCCKNTQTILKKYKVLNISFKMFIWMGIPEKWDFGPLCGTREPVSQHIKVGPGTIEVELGAWDAGLQNVQVEHGTRDH